MKQYAKFKRTLSSSGKKDRASYEYSATRARAMASKLIRDENYTKFLKMDINEIVRFLEEHEYKREIDTVGAKASKIVYFEQVLNENLSNSINKLLTFTPPNSPVRTYLMRYDIANIKTIMRGKRSKRSKSEIKRSLIAIGTFSRGNLENLVEKEWESEIIDGLKKTVYYNVLKSNEKKSLEELEDALDRFYFEKVLEVAKGHKSLENLIKTEIDVKNVLTILRLRDIKTTDLERFLIKEGGIKVEKLLELSRLDFFEIIKSLQKKNFWKYAPTNTKELDKIEAGFRKYLILEGFKLLKSYVPSFDTLLGYIIAKERELSNLRIIARSKTSKTPEDALNIRAKIYLKGV